MAPARGKADPTTGNIAQPDHQVKATAGKEIDDLYRRSTGLTRWGVDATIRGRMPTARHVTDDQIP